LGRAERELGEKTREVAGGNVKLMTKLLAFLEMYYPPVDPAKNVTSSVLGPSQLSIPENRTLFLLFFSSDSKRKSERERGARARRRPRRLSTRMRKRRNQVIRRWMASQRPHSRTY